MSEWIGDAPKKCDICGVDIDEVFYDAKTQMGPWAFMCPSCHVLGPGLGKTGTGYGQKYIKTINNKWLKREG